jgi:UDP-GlcNAc:undecaprenyl-phosphate/decaprenyl-phosphate GlcNAc-1-phosphate transferase
MASANLPLILVSAFLLGACATPVTRRLALRLGILDHPDERKHHDSPVPLLGGVAIYGAVVAALLVYGDRREVTEAGGILLGATWVAFWGLWDDCRRLGVAAKLGVQLVAALMLIGSGVQVQLWLPDWINVALTILWVIGITNAFNLLDNVDGLCGGTAGIAAAWFLVLASLNGQYLVGAFAAALLGACLAFLIYNVNPARIFMGDAGSLLIGFLIAALGIKLRFPDNVPWITWMVPVIVLGVPILDTSLVFLSRLRRRRNPLTTPGRDHLSHRLMQLGWRRGQAVLLLQFAAGVLGAAALFVSVSTLAAAWAVGALIAAAGIGTLIWLERRAPSG